MANAKKDTKKLYTFVHADTIGPASVMSATPSSDRTGYPRWPCWKDWRDDRDKLRTGRTFCGAARRNELPGKTVPGLTGICGAGEGRRRRAAGAAPVGW